MSIEILSLTGQGLGTITCHQHTLTPVTLDKARTALLLVLIDNAALSLVLVGRLRIVSATLEQVCTTYFA